MARDTIAFSDEAQQIINDQLSRHSTKNAAVNHIICEYKKILKKDQEIQKLRDEIYDLQRAVRNEQLQSNEIKNALKVIKMLFDSSTAPDPALTKTRGNP